IFNCHYTERSVKYSELITHETELIPMFEREQYEDTEYIYNGGFPPYDDPADYIPITVPASLRKAVRLG
ncbi:hypothetical protein O0536_25285, partial [Brevibacillus laterosporus]|uniref:hypothetical protein n=1 Tax=Brevibacillus laterosporus TaxID=1465 RepID=UPI0022A7B19C